MIPAGATSRLPSVEKARRRKNGLTSSSPNIGCVCVDVFDLDGCTIEFIDADAEVEASTSAGEPDRDAGIEVDVVSTVMREFLDNSLTLISPDEALVSTE